MKDAYKNIRLANTILESAEKLGMEADVLIDMGIQWLTGDLNDDDGDELFPEASAIMSELEDEYDSFRLGKVLHLLRNIDNTPF